MKLDKRALQRLMALNDDQLMQVVERLAAESGLNLGALKVSKEDLARLRAALGGADERDTEYFKRQLGQMGQFGRSNGNPNDRDPSDGNPQSGGKV